MVGTIAAIVLATAVLVLLVVFMLLKREYDASPFPRLFDEIDERREALLDLLNEVAFDRSQKRKELANITRRIRRDAIEQRLRRTPVDALADHGAMHVNWSALRQVGVGSCWDLRRYETVDALQRIRGIGVKSARRIVRARARLQSEVDERPITPRELQNTGLFDAARVLAYEISVYETLDTRVIARTRRFLDEGSPPGPLIRYFLPDRWLDRSVRELNERWRTVGQELLYDLEQLAEDMSEALDTTSTEDQALTRAAYAVLHASNQIELAATSIPSEPTANSQPSGSKTTGRSSRPIPQASAGAALADSDLRQTSGIQRRRFTSEHSFEEGVISPLLNQFRLEFERQKQVEVPTGHKYTSGYADYVVYDDEGLLTVIENKKSVPTQKRLGKAADQGASYARVLRSTSVVVAAPQGLWIFEVGRFDVKLKKSVEPTDVASDHEEIVGLLRKLRGH